MLPRPHQAKKYFSYSLYFLGQILRALKFGERGKRVGGGNEYSDEEWT